MFYLEHGFPIKKGCTRGKNPLYADKNKPNYGGRTESKANMGFFPSSLLVEKLFPITRYPGVSERLFPHCSWITDSKQKQACLHWVLAEGGVKAAQHPQKATECLRKWHHWQEQRAQVDEEVYRGGNLHWRQIMQCETINCNQRGFDSRVQRWRKCMAYNEDYVEECPCVE